MPVAPDPVFSIGTTGNIKEVLNTDPVTFGTPETLDNLKGISSEQWQMTFTEVGGVADQQIVRRPVRLDKGTITLTFNVKNTAVASNQFTTFRTKLLSKKRWKITLDLMGTGMTFDDSTPLVVFEGYISSVSAPTIETSDNSLTFEVGFQCD